MAATEVRLDHIGLPQDLDDPLTRIEVKLDRVIAFQDMIMAQAGPFLTGKGAKLLAMYIKARS